jgi:hypothetical protein
MKGMMPQFFAFARPLSIVLFAVLLLSAPTAQAALVYALTDENDLLSFDSASPEDLLGARAITGLQSPNEDLVGIDIRPANNLLYGVSNFGVIYTIDPANGFATLVSAISTPLVGSRFGVDFNPVADRLRIVSDVDQNLRVNVDTGVATVDTPLQYGPGQINYTGTNPSIVGAAYTNSYGPSPRAAPGTTLYGIDSVNDQLVIQNPPNNGTLTVVTGANGFLRGTGFGLTSVLGFDILTVGPLSTGFAAVQYEDEGASRFYSINLSNGAPFQIGVIGGGDLIDGIAVTGSMVPEPTSGMLLAAGLLAGVVARRRAR